MTEDKGAEHIRIKYNIKKFPFESLPKSIIILLSLSCILVLVAAFTGYFISRELPNYIGIAVDSHENIYLSDTGEIAVIDNKGNAIRKISVEGNRGFPFSIIDDKIYMNTVRGNYVTDLYGNELDISMTDEEVDAVQTRSQKSFTTEDGTSYYLRDNHVYRIKDGNEELIY